MRIRAVHPEDARPGSNRARPARAGWLLVACAALAAGCDSGPREIRPTPPTVVRDVPSVLRGTIGAEATLNGIEPIIVSGLGLVVGLNGTGGGPLPVNIQATMERELARGGIGKGGPLESGPLAGKSPREVLRDPNTAVVIVQGVIAPGSPKGAQFDVLVRAAGTSVTSLEGGQLWTTELRLGPPSVFGSVRTRVIGDARGAVFINPFAEPGLQTNDPLARTVGRVLGGGRVTDPLGLELRLDNPSATRARAVVAAINGQFPEQRGDTEPAARGINQQSIELRVPRRYRDTPDEFLQLLRFTQVDQQYPQEFAKRYVDELVKQPELATELSWCLQALGKPAIPFLVPLYDHPEFRPRMAALRAGARLGDQRTVPHLRELASSGPPSLRASAIALLGGLPPDPPVNEAIRTLLGAPELDVRVAAYEALAERRDVAVVRTLIAVEGRQKFYIDIVDAPEPMVYITQQGEPRIVLFGGDRALQRPMLVSAWSDRLLMSSDGPKSPVRLRYEDYRTGRVTVAEAPATVAELVGYLARRPTPEDPTPGLDMTYSEVVGALYEIQKQGGIEGAFATEQERLAARLLEAEVTSTLGDRPESEEARERARVNVLSAARQPAARAPDADADRPVIVPLPGAAAPPPPDR